MPRDLKPFDDTCPNTQRPVEVAQCEKCPHCKAIVESKITCVKIDDGETGKEHYENIKKPDLDNSTGTPE